MGGGGQGLGGGGQGGCERISDVIMKIQKKNRVRGGGGVQVRVDVNGSGCRVGRGTG